MKLLHSRFGLYGTPFEAELLDQEPPVPAKFSSTPLAYTTAVAAGDAIVWNGVNTTGGGNFGTPEVSGAGPEDLRDLLNMRGNHWYNNI